LIYRTLTPEQKAAYLADSSKCPYCQSDDICGDDIDFEGSSIAGVPAFVRQIMFCQACERGWNDNYKLIDINDEVIQCEVCREALKNGQEVILSDDLCYYHPTCLKLVHNPELN